MITKAIATVLQHYSNAVMRIITVIAHRVNRYRFNRFKTVKQLNYKEMNEKKKKLHVIENNYAN